MPYRRKRIYKKKRKATRRTGFLKTRGPGLTGSTPLGKTITCKTRYVDPNIVIDAASLTAGIHVFSMNGLYDPDITGTGHQALGFDQMMLMYDHYTVIGSRLRVTLTNTDTSNAQTVAVSLKDTATTSTVGNTLENGLSRWTVLSPANAGGSTRTLSINCSPTKFFNRKVLQGDKYYGTISSNPTDGVYAHIQVVAVDSIVNPAAVQATVVIEYIVVYTEPKLLLPS